MDNKTRLVLLGVTVIAIVVAIIWLENGKSDVGRGTISVQDVNIDLSDARVSQKTSTYETAKEITTPDGFINTEGITIDELIGKKVILIDFWTYSCINCQRTTPYLNAWYDKYKDQGLEIIGIHTPEFEFEKEYENVAAAVEQFGIEFPVVLDNDFSTWRAYENRYWPRKYLIDIDGFVVYDHIGEGGYEETEEVIQQLLTERSLILDDKPMQFSGTSEVDAIDVDFGQVDSPEVYFGAARNELLGHGVKNVIGEQDLSIPDKTNRNTLYLEGLWDIQEEYAIADNADEFLFDFEAKNVYTVASGDAVIHVYVDDEDFGTIEVSAEELYQLVQLTDYGKHTLRVVVESGQIIFYTLTFG